jgi:hypothetical protein
MDHSSPYSPSIQRSNSTAEAYQSSDSHKRVVSVETEWYELVDQSVVDSLPKDEQRRQGLWWELIKAGSRALWSRFGVIIHLFSSLRADSTPSSQKYLAQYKRSMRDIPGCSLSLPSDSGMSGLWYANSSYIPASMS